MVSIFIFDQTDRTLGIPTIHVVVETANFLRCSMNNWSETSSVSTGAPPSCREKSKVISKMMSGKGLGQG